MTKENIEEFAYSSIMNLIRENTFKPGDFLLETELTETLGLKSRTPVRHALARISSMGYIVKKKKKGCYIPSTCPDDAKHVFYARESIESAAAHSAAVHATDDELNDLRAIIAHEEETGKSGRKEAYSRLNEEFHKQIVTLSRNEYIIRYSDYIFWRSSVYVFMFGRYYTRPDFADHMFAPAQHKNILEALTERNPEKARTLAAEHIRYTFERIFRWM